MTEQTGPEVFDLDALEREGEGAGKPPFKFAIAGNEYELINAEELDYRDLLAAFNAANAADFETAMGHLLPEDQREGFVEHEIPLWKLEKLFDRYTKHFGLTPGKKAGRLPRR